MRASTPIAHTHQHRTGGDYSTRAQAASSPSELRAFFDRFTGSGFLCLGEIVGDPAGKHFTQRWFEWPRQREAALQQAERAAAAGRNLYVAVSLFESRERGYATALPFDWLWLDDADVPGAEHIETSEGNFQSWLKLDRPISVHERRHFQRAIRNETPGADTTSANAIHMARVPGGTNAKPKRGGWTVRVARRSSRVWSVDELRARYGAPSEGETPTEAPRWENLPDGAALARSARFTRLRERNWQLDTVCKGGFVPLPHASGDIDLSRSGSRSVLFYQLIRARYPIEEIQALYLHFYDQLSIGRDGKILTLAQYERDFGRLQGKYHIELSTYKPEATRGLQRIWTPQPGTVGGADASAPPEPASAPRGGRHYEITATELLDFYASIADSGPTGTRADVTLTGAAEALHVSVSTIRRREAELIAAGLIRRTCSEDRHSSYVLLGGVCSQPIETPSEPAPGLPIASPAPASPVCSESALPHADAAPGLVASVCEERACVEITHSPPCLIPGLGDLDAGAAGPGDALDEPLDAISEACDVAQGAGAALPPGACVPSASPQLAPAVASGADAPPDLAPDGEALDLGSRGLPLLELVDRALDLAAAASIRKQRAIVRAIVLAERPREDLDAIDRCLDAVRDRRKLRAFTDKRLGAERAKRRRAADKAAVDVATGSTAARERPAEQIAQLQSRAWALRYRAERADRVWLERYDSLPTDTNPAPQPRAGAAELDAALDIRGRVNPAAAMRRAERRRRLDAGMDVAEADARELVEWDGLGLNRLSLAEPVTPEPLVEVHPARPSDGIGDRLRALKQQRALAQEAA